MNRAPAVVSRLENHLEYFPLPTRATAELEAEASLHARGSHLVAGDAVGLRYRVFKRHFPIRTLTLAALLLVSTGAWAQGAFLTPEPVGTAAPQQTVLVTSQGGGTVNSVLVLTGGLPGLDFTPGTGTSTCEGKPVLGASQTCTESVAFTPGYPGVRMGAVVLLDSTNKVLGTAYLSGTGLGGLGVLVPGNVVTDAGVTGAWTSTQDGIPATQANLNQPASVVADAAGNLYIADSVHNKIRKVAAPVAPATVGIISTYAGSGVAGYSGFGTAATAATLNSPSGVALDGAGNLYIADTLNSVVRKVTAANGEISTVAGTGTAGYNGDNVAATTVELNQPWGVTVDPSGNLYIADTSNQRIRMVNAVTGIITTVAGNGTPSGLGNGKGTFSGDGNQATLAGLSLPYAVAFDIAGDMYIPDSANNRIRMVNTTGIISTVAGNGTASYSGDGHAATSATLYTPSGVAVDPAGNVYIADTQNHAIRKVNATSGDISTVAADGLGITLSSSGTVGTVNLYAPTGLFLDGNANLFVADYLNMVVLEMTSNMAALDYETTAVRQGDKSTPQSQTLENDGNNPLDLTGLRLGSNSAFDSGTTTCTTGSPMLAEDTSCVIGAVFAPSTSGDPLRGDLYIDDVAQNTPLDIALIGNATAVNSTTVVLGSGLNPSTYGTGVTLTASVTTGAGTGSLTGTVTFTDGSTTLATGVALNGSDAATYTISTLTVGSHSITATYSGDAGHFTSTSTPALVQVVNEGTATGLTSSVNPSGTGANVTFTATVTAPSGGGIAPDGSVSFFDGSTPLGNVALNAGGVATYSTAALSNGVHPITAVYGGDAAKYVLGNTSGVLNQDVVAPSTSAVVSNLNPSNYGLPVTFTATVTSSGTAAATGTVTFFDGGQQIGTATLAGAPGAATLKISTLAVGSHSITVAYGGDTNTASSTSPAITQVVSITQTATTEVAAPNPGIAGAPVAITASVTVTLGAATPTGLVTFTDGTVGLGSATLGSGVTATIRPTLAPGAHSIVATYAGDTDDGGSASAPFALTVQQATTSTTVASNPNPSVVEAPITFTAKVTGNGGMPTGSVTFMADGVTMNLANLDATGTATLTYSGLSVGSHAITALYTGDVNDASSTSTAITQVVGTIPTVTDLGSATSSGASPQPILVAAVLGSIGPAPTGTVTFTNGTTVIGSASLDSSGVATLTPNLQTGSYAIVAAYSGDALHGSSTSQPVTITNPATGFILAVTPATVALKTTQNTTVAITLTSVGSFADTIGLGCASLPSGVNCHFATITSVLAAGATQTVQLTIDTNSPLTGGLSAMNGHAGSLRVSLAGIFLPAGLFLGLVVWRFRKRHVAILTGLLVLVASCGTLLLAGCSGLTQSNAAPGTYVIQVVGVGANSNISRYENVTLNITQ